VIVGTLGKALGGYGAYVCTSRETVDYLVNTARPFIFSTAPAPR
jgi:7-keto-8-aminopelargonate synthetase-like enzyme